MYHAEICCRMTEPRGQPKLRVAGETCETVRCGRLYVCRAAYLQKPGAQRSTQGPWTAQREAFASSDSKGIHRRIALPQLKRPIFRSQYVDAVVSSTTQCLDLPKSLPSQRSKLNGVGQSFLPALHLSKACQYFLRTKLGRAIELTCPLACPHRTRGPDSKPALALLQFVCLRGMVSSPEDRTTSHGNYCTLMSRRCRHASIHSTGPAGNAGCLCFTSPSPSKMHMLPSAYTTILRRQKVPRSHSSLFVGSCKNHLRAPA